MNEEVKSTLIGVIALVTFVATFPFAVTGMVIPCVALLTITILILLLYHTKMETKSSIRCLLGFHDWCILLPGQRKVTYQGKEWWTMGGMDFNYCQRCGKVAKGTLLFPAGWEGKPIHVGVDE